MISKKLTWLGHNFWHLDINGTLFSVDPFFSNDELKKKNAALKTDYVLVSHGHSDHCADAFDLAQRNNATLCATAETTSWFAKKGIKKTEAMNIGGAIPLPMKNGATAQLLMVSATHTSTMPDGVSGGCPCGFVLSIPEQGKKISSLFVNQDSSTEIVSLFEALKNANAFSIYFACDTGFFVDMSWIGGLGIDVAVLPIGDRYTMGPSASLDAIHALKPKTAVPCHFGTWPPLTQNVSHWAKAVEKRTEAKPLVFEVGTTHEI